MLGGLNPLYNFGTPSPLSLHFPSTKSEGSMGMTHLVQSEFGYVLMCALAVMIVQHLLVQLSSVNPFSLNFAMRKMWLLG